MASIDTLEVTTVIDAGSGFPIGLRTHERPPRFLGTPFVLAQSHVASALTGTTAETILASVVLPGGVMGLNGSIVIDAVWSASATANTKTVILAMGGSTFSTGILFATSAVAARQSQWIGNRNSLTAQISHHPAHGISVAGTGSPLVATAVNTAADQTVSIRGALAVAGDTLTLESWRVVVYPSE